jgi:hypothetical protein
VLFNQDNKKKRNKSNWKFEYEDTVYKIYDWNKNLAGYFFPKYNLIKQEAGARHGNEKAERQEEEEEEDNDRIIERMNKLHETVKGGNLMIPMLRLNLLDNEEGGIDLKYAIEALGENLKRAKQWTQWLEQNYAEFRIVGNALYTAREDRNMLSIVLDINSDIILGEKEIGMQLVPLLDKMHEDGML